MPTPTARKSPITLAAKATPTPANDGMDDASVAALAEAILKVIEKEPLYYSAVAERFADHTFQAVARALGLLHGNEKLWQDPRGRLCVRGSAFAAKVPQKG